MQKIACSRDCNESEEKIKRILFTYDLEQLNIDSELKAELIKDQDKIMVIFFEDILEKEFHGEKHLRSNLSPKDREKFIAKFNELKGRSGFDNMYSDMIEFAKLFFSSVDYDKFVPSLGENHVYYFNQSPLVQKALDELENGPGDINVSQEKYEERSEIIEIEEATKKSIMIPKDYIIYEKYKRMLESRNKNLNGLQREFSQETLKKFTEDVLKPLYYGIKFGKQKFSRTSCYFDGYIKTIQSEDVESASRAAVDLLGYLIKEISFESWVENEELLNLFFDSPITVKTFNKIDDKELKKVEQKICDALKRTKTITPNIQANSNNKESFNPLWKKVLLFIGGILVVGIGLKFSDKICNIVSTLFKDSQWVPSALKPDATPKVANVGKLPLIKSIF